MFLKFFPGIIGCLFLSNLVSFGNGFNQVNGIQGIASLHQGIRAVFYNPAGIAGDSSFGVSVFYRSHFLLDQLSSKGFVSVVPLGRAITIGAGYQQFGYDLYKEQRAGIAFARSFGAVVMAGIRFDYLSTRFGNEYGQSSSITGSAGLIARVTDQLRLGVCIFNPQRARLSKQERYPSLMQAGLSWSFTKSELGIGISKQGNAKEIIACAFRYNVSPKFLLHAGVSGGSESFSFGYSFKFSKIEIGMASGYHYYLGFSPQFFLTFKNK